MTLRILHVLDHSLPLQSGYVYRTMGILREQRKLGWQTIHLTTPKHYLRGPTPEAIDGFEFHRTSAFGSSLQRVPILRELAQVHRTSVQIKQLIREHRPDIIHAHSPVLNAMAALLARRRTNVPMVYEVRSFWEDAAVQHGTSNEHGIRYFATRFMETKVLNAVEAVTAISDGLRSDILGRGIPEAKLTVIPNAVDPIFLEAPTTPNHELISVLKIEDKTVLGFAGSFYSYEGLDLLIRALPDILAEHPDVRLLLVGGGPDESQLKSLVKAGGMEDVVIFAGRVPQSEVLDYYRSMDVLVFPRRASRLTELVTPLKPLEAMALGRIVVASDVGGHRELVDDGRTGFLIPADSPTAVAKGLVEVLDDRSEWEDIRQNGRRFIERQRTWPKAAIGYEKIYQGLLARSS